MCLHWQGGTRGNFRWGANGPDWVGLSWDSLINIQVTWPTGCRMTHKHMGWAVWHSMDIFMSPSPVVIWPRSQTHSCQSLAHNRSWLHHSSNFGCFFLCISFLKIYSGQTPAFSIDSYLSMCIEKKISYFVSSSVWAKLSELGRALQAFKFATICKLSRFGLVATLLVPPPIPPILDSTHSRLYLSLVLPFCSMTSWGQ